MAGNYDVLADIPIGLSGGGDFITGGGSRTVHVRTPGGGVDVRKERWVITGKVITYTADDGSELPPPPPGRVGFSESTVTEMANALGMVHESEMHRITAELREVRAELEVVSEEKAALLRENENLRSETDPRTIYVAPDGTEHGSRRALDLHTAAAS